jgi:hypothetical protein
MLKPVSLLTCIIVISSIGTSRAAPPDSPGTVYIDGTPCNLACQSYLAWSRRMLEQQANPSSIAFSAPSRRAQRLSKVKTQRTARILQSAPSSAVPIRIAKGSAQKRVGSPPPRTAATEETKPAPETITDPAPTSKSALSSVELATPGQVSTGDLEQNPTTASTRQAPEQTADDDTKESRPQESRSPPDAETAALASNNAERLVAILLVRSEIRSVSDLANKIIAIDASRSASIPSVRKAIVAAGGTEIRMSEGKALAIERVMDGEVQAAVVTLAGPEEAAAWTEIPGFRILRITISASPERPDRG